MNNTTAKIVEPWLNSDPCSDCKDCEKVCKRLKERIDKEVGDILIEIDEACQMGLNSPHPEHWEAALQDILDFIRSKNAT